MCEKQTLLTDPSQVGAANRVGGNGRFRRLVVRCGVALLVLQLIRIAHFSDWDVVNRPSKHPRKSWRSGKPIYRTKNSTIGWHVCPDNPPATKFLCSTHKVPLNWLDPVKGENLEIFLRMLPADDDKRQGSLLVNPGGPGGSGNVFVYVGGPGLAVITERKLDIIGFDPRGVNMTAPRLKLFDNAYDFALFNDRNPAMDLSHNPSHPINASDPHVFSNELAHFQHMEDLAKLRVDAMKKYTSEAVRKSVSTPFVVRDMVSLVDALGEKDGLLTYWGFSYGTILGAYFAAMMPDRVGRLVLDGVSHAGDYTKSVFDWAWSSMTDTQSVFQEFADICSSSGSGCSLATPKTVRNDDDDLEPFLSKPPTGDEIIDHIQTLWHDLWKRPVGAETEDGFVFVGGREFESALFTTLYSPSRWPLLATALSALPNATLLHSMIATTQALRTANLEQSTRSDTDNVFDMPIGQDGGTVGILCGDSGLKEMEGPLEDWVRFSGKLQERSAVGGNLWMHLILICRGWKDRPYERYEGPWTVADGLRKTKNKVLWIGNTYDNVTPLRSAKRMAEGFGRESGVLLEHGGHGHCSIAEPSLCTIKAIRDYLLDGVIPEDGKYCATEPGYIFPGKSKMDAEIYSDAERELMDAVERVSHALLS